MIIPYLSDMINDHKIEEQKLQLGMRVSDNKEIRWGSETDDNINKLFKSFLDNYQKNSK